MNLRATFSPGAKERTSAVELPRKRRRPAGSRPVFSDILCGVDGSRGSLAAAEQAIALCEQSSRVTFLAVYYEAGKGFAEQAALSKRRAEDALARAAQEARDADVNESRSLIGASHPTRMILDQAIGHDLLVVGSHGTSRLGGIMLGSTATRVAHQPQRPVLIARRPPNHTEFPAGLIVATDGSAGSWAPVRVASRLAAGHGLGVHVVYVPSGTQPQHYRQVLKQVAMIEAETGIPPVVQDKPGAVPERICQCAESEHSSLVVIGRRGLGGARALGSVSERVVHRAPCSVLVVPPNGEVH